MEDFSYISLVGTQAMGCLNALLALFDNGMSPSEVYLIPTPKSHEFAERIRKYLFESAGYSAVKIYETPMSGIDEGIVEELNAVLKEKAVVYNADGGMNFMSCDLSVALNIGHLYILQATNGKIRLTDTADYTSVELSLPYPIKLSQFEFLQNIEFESVEKKGFDLIEFCKNHDIAFPEGAKFHVRLKDKNIFFDAVWMEVNNRPVFLKTALSKDHNQQAKDDGKIWLEYLRNIGNWANSRKSRAGIYDCKVIVVVDEPNSKERLCKEFGDKITLCDVEGWIYKNNESIFINKLREAIKPKYKVLREIKHTEKKQYAAVAVESDTLICSFSSQASSAMAAIYSHKPKNLLLLVSEKDKAVKNAADYLKQNLHEEWLEKVEILPIEFEGIHIPEQLKLAEGAENVVVNITPGSKGQGVFLSLWAKKNGISVYSIHTQKGECVPLSRLSVHNNGCCFPLTTCSPSFYLQATGQEIHSLTEISELEEERELYAAVLEWLRRIPEGQNIVTCSPQQGDITVSIPKPSRKLPSSSRIITVYRNNKLLGTIQQEGGEWLEILAGFAAADAGLKNVQIRVRGKWSAEAEKGIREKRGDIEDDKLFRFDMDVLASWRSYHILISCKSNPYENTKTKETAANEAENMSSLTGRFAIPLLCHFYTEKPDVIECQDNKQIVIFGWRTLCHPEEWLECIKKAIRLREE